MKRRGLKLGGCSLDRQQIEAVLACEDAQLVLASAGSGKTMSLIAKIEYLVGSLGLRADEILAISFTKKTVEELIERCPVKGVEFRTFHSLGKSIIDFCRAPGLSSRVLLTEEQLNSFLSVFIESNCCDNENFLRDYSDFLFFYFSAARSPGDFKTHAERISLHSNYLRKSLGSTLRIEAREHKECSLRQDFIRSKEEQLVADWLFVHGLEYFYHREVEGLSEKLRPSFTIIDKANGVYVFLEVLVINADSTSIYGRDYLKNLKRSRAIYKKHQLKHAEMYSYE